MLSTKKGLSDSMNSSKFEYTYNTRGPKKGMSKKNRRSKQEMTMSFEDKRKID